MDRLSHPHAPSLFAESRSWNRSVSNGSWRKKERKKKNILRWKIEIADSFDPWDLIEETLLYNSITISEIYIYIYTFLSVLNLRTGVITYTRFLRRKTIRFTWVAGRTSEIIGRYNWFNAVYRINSVPAFNFLAGAVAEQREGRREFSYSTLDFARKSFASVANFNELFEQQSGRGEKKREKRIVHKSLDCEVQNIRVSR